MSFSNSFGDASLQMLDRVGFKNIFTHEQVKEWHNIVILEKKNKEFCDHPINCIELTKRSIKLISDEANSLTKNET